MQKNRRESSEKCYVDGTKDFAINGPNLTESFVKSINSYFYGVLIFFSCLDVRVYVRARVYVSCMFTRDMPDVTSLRHTRFM